mmetsp:Transcript_124728/g.233253  ORF Transcript_124728/g.233253 Transcript_124728/m.233253 type:complete len:358 (-) Transcript_124728:290-1363(-)
MKTPTTSGVRLLAIRSEWHRFTSPAVASDSAGGEVATGAVRSPKRRTSRTTAWACSTDAWRLDFAKMTPIRLAPAATAPRASSGRTTPQTFTKTAPGATGSTASLPTPPLAGLPIISRMAAPGSAARISASPTSTPLQEISLHCATSSAEERPLNASSLALSPGPKGVRKVVRSSEAICAVRPLSSSNVCRLRLFTPRTRAPASKATSSSCFVTTSTSGSRLLSLQQRIRSRSLERERMETISKTVSAPCATASNTWYSSTKKSLRKQAGLREPLSFAHCAVLSRTLRRSSREPLNHFGSVNTERMLAPTFVYSRACTAASRSALMSPFDGDARLNSAARARPQGDCSATERHSASC